MKVVLGLSPKQNCLSERFN